MATKATKLTLEKGLSLEDTLINLLNNKFGGKFTIDIYGNRESGGVRIRKSSNTYAYAKFRLDQYPYTCGMYEIGNLDLDIDDSYKTIVTKNRMARLIAKAIEKSVDACTNGGAKFGLSCTIPYEDADYEVWEDAIKRVGFKDTGEFKNINSGNRIRHYVLI